jgi:hypothetical protein
MIDTVIRPRIAYKNTISSKTQWSSTYPNRQHNILAHGHPTG